MQCICSPAPITSASRSPYTQELYKPADTTGKPDTGNRRARQTQSNDQTQPG